MMSKPIKSLPRKALLDLQEEEPKFFNRMLQKIAYAYKTYLYYPVDNFFRRNYERASRSLAFAKRGWMHYDFESAYLYDIMAFKMKRILECLEDGHAIQEDEDLNALREAIVICERLFNGEYEDKYYDIHGAKWGELDMKSEPVYDDNGKIKHYTCDLSRPNVKTEEDEVTERAELRTVYENGEKDRRLDIDRLAQILKDHESSWWD